MGTSGFLCGFSSGSGSLHTNHDPTDGLVLNRGFGSSGSSVGLCVSHVPTDGFIEKLGGGLSGSGSSIRIVSHPPTDGLNWKLGSTRLIPQRGGWKVIGFDNHVAVDGA